MSIGCRILPLDKYVFLLGASDTYPVKSTGGSATHTQTVGEMARHSHTLDLSNAGIDDNEYEYTVSYSRNKKITIAATRTIQANGGNQPMDILNPYYAVNIWRRIE
nr:MAG TPA: baseplate protein [Caudoviricetes sp.]